MGKITKRDYYEVLKHWEDNVVASIKGEWYDWSKEGKDCAFCNRLRGTMVGANCLRCPIYKNTGFTDCDVTPWHDTCVDDPDSNWEEYQYLLTLALSNGMADEYLNEIEWEE